MLCISIKYKDRYNPEYIHLYTNTVIKYFYYTHICVCIYIYVYTHMCVCVCVYKWKKESTKVKEPGAHESLACIRVCSVAQLCPTLCDPMDCGPPGSSGDSPGKNTGVGCHAFLQGIFPTQGSNSSLAGGFFTTSTSWEAP